MDGLSVSNHTNNIELEDRPQGVAGNDDQGDSETCVRFAISKAIVNDLFIAKQIDINQKNICICLIQAVPHYSPINKIEPLKFHGKILYLQDKENRCMKYGERVHSKPRKAWWKVKKVK